MGTLGYASEYVVRIEDTLLLPAYTTAGVAATTVYHDIDWTSITWGRVANNPSQARIKVANDRFGRTCCPYPLHAWTQAIGIYRNGLKVWWGPLVGWKSDGESVELSAMDLLAFAQRYINFSLTTDITDTPNNVLNTILNAPSATWPSIYPRLNPLVIPQLDWPISTSLSDNVYTFSASSGATVFEQMNQVMSQSQSYMSMTSDTIVYSHQGPQGANWIANREGTSLNESTVINKPAIVVDGSQIASTTYASRSNFGIGGTDAWIAVLPIYGDPYVPDGLLHATTSMNPRSFYTIDGQSADAAARNRGPQVTIEALQLAPAFGGPGFESINDLSVGRLVAKWAFDYSCLSDVDIYGPGYFSGSISSGSYYPQHDDKLYQAMLVQLDVDVQASSDGVSETVSASFVPLAGAPLGTTI